MTEDEEFEALEQRLNYKQSDKQGSLIQAMKLALEALAQDRAWLESDAPKEMWDKNNEAITALRQAIEQAEQAQPVAEIQVEDMGRPFNAMRVTTRFFKEVPPVGTKLYTAPPPRQPDVSLIDEGKKAEQAQPEPRFVRNVDGVPCITLTEHKHLMSLQVPPPRQPLSRDELRHLYWSATDAWAFYCDVDEKLFGRAAHNIKGKA